MKEFIERPGQYLINIFEINKWREKRKSTFFAKKFRDLGTFTVVKTRCVPLKKTYIKENKQIPVFNETESFVINALNDFHISIYKDEAIEEANRVFEHKHTYYEIIWVEKGKGLHTIDFVEYDFKGPCLFLLHPQNIHKIFKERLSQGGVIKFTDSVFSLDESGINFLLKYGVFDDIDVLPVINLESDEAKSIKQLFIFLHKEDKNDGSFSSPIILSHLKAFLLKVYQIKKKHVKSSVLQSSDYIRFKKFQKLIEDNYKVEHGVSSYASKLHVTNRTLSNICKSVIGKSPQILIKERLLLEAKRLLAYSDLSVKEVANKLGYNDYSYFTRLFAKNTGTTPSNFRKETSFHIS